MAVIPARGGSKGVPGKNLRLVGGIPLVVRAVRACRSAALVDTVYVSTDDASIAAAAREAGAEVVLRPVELAGDLASSEAALLHALDQLELLGHSPEALVFVQCTSPFVDPRDLDSAVRQVLDDDADSVFSGVATYEFLWTDAPADVEPGTGRMVGVNHDAAVRPRRQDRRPHFRETGAFYVMDAAGFRAAGHRFFGRTAVVGVQDLTGVEIDTEDDLVLAEALARVIDPPAGSVDRVPEDGRAGHPGGPPLDVDAVVTDFDGVHTPDTAYLDQTGRESVRVSRSDGLGVARLRAAGVPLLILSKERNPVVAARAAKLGVEVLQAVDDKAPAVRAWLADHRIEPERAAYVGNDVNDLEAMRAVGWPVAVQDAHPEVRAAARLVLTRPGGQGAVRELCDLVVAARERPAAAPAAAAGPPPPVASPGRSAPAAAAGGPAHRGSPPA